MKMRTALCLVAACLPLGAGAEPVTEPTLGLKVGTLGIGVEGSYALSERWGLRGSFNTFSYGFDDDVDGVTYDGDLDLNSIALLADFRPWSSAFRISGGALVNNNEISAAADPAPTYDIGDNVYTLEEVGQLSAVADFDTVAPYLGLGWDLRMSEALRFSLDLGVLFQGEAGVSIQSTGGTLSNDPGLRADLDAEEQSFRDDLEDYDLYPVLSVGMSYAFR